jgi:hypothetical protein
MARHADPSLAGQLKTLISMANGFGAEGIWLIRGAVEPELRYQVDPEQIDPDLPKNVSLDLEIVLGLAEAGVLVVMRFPASDGGQDGVEKR